MHIWFCLFVQILCIFMQMIFLLICEYFVFAYFQVSIFELIIIILCTYIACFLFACLSIFLHFWYCTLLHISCIYICIFKSAYYGIFTTISPWAYSRLESICLHIQCRFFYILKMHACAYLVLHICVYCCISMHSVFAYLSIFLLPRPISLINI